MMNSTEVNGRATLDEQIHDRVRTAQVVLASLLGEATSTRQHLQGLHQRLGGQPSTLVTIPRKA